MFLSGLLSYVVYNEIVDRLMFLLSFKQKYPFFDRIVVAFPVTMTYSG